MCVRRKQRYTLDNDYLDHFENEMLRIGLVSFQLKKLQPMQKRRKNYAAVYITIVSVLATIRDVFCILNPDLLNINEQITDPLLAFGKLGALVTHILIVSGYVLTILIRITAMHLEGKSQLGFFTVAFECGKHCKELRRLLAALWLIYKSFTSILNVLVASVLAYCVYDTGKDKGYLTVAVILFWTAMTYYSYYYLFRSTFMVIIFTVYTVASILCQSKELRQMMLDDDHSYMKVLLNTYRLFMLVGRADVFAKYVLYYLQLIGGFLVNVAVFAALYVDFKSIAVNYFVGLVAAEMFIPILMQLLASGKLFSEISRLEKPFYWRMIQTKPGPSSVIKTKIILNELQGNKVGFYCSTWFPFTYKEVLNLILGNISLHLLLLGFARDLSYI